MFYQLRWDTENPWEHHSLADQHIFWSDQHRSSRRMCARIYVQLPLKHDLIDSSKTNFTAVHEAPSWLPTNYDKSERNKCFIIYKSLINLFSIVEYNLFRQITKQSASESAVIFQFVKQTPEFICMNGFNVCFKFIISWNFSAFS